jgi:lysophospholipase L1-like esterase
MTTVDVTLRLTGADATTAGEKPCTEADQAAHKCNAEVIQDNRHLNKPAASDQSTADTKLPKVEISGAGNKTDPTVDAAVQRAGSDVKGLVWEGDYPTDSYKGDKVLAAKDDFKSSNSDAHDYMTMIQTGKGHYQWVFGPSGLTVDSMNTWLKIKGVDTDHLNEQAIAAIHDKDVAAVAKFASVAAKLDASKGWGSNSAEEKKITDTAERIMDDAPLLSMKLQDQIVADLGHKLAVETIQTSNTAQTKTVDEGKLSAALLLGHAPADADKAGNENVMQFAQIVDNYRQQHAEGDIDPAVIAFALTNAGRLPKDDKELAATSDKQTDADADTLSAPQEPPVILGDSLTWWLGKKRDGMGGAQVYGIIGEKADHLADRIEKMDLSGRTAALWIGTNDLGNGVKEPLTDNEVVARVEAAAVAARSANAQHVVLAAIPYRGDSYTRTYGGLPVPVLNQRISDINDKLASWANSQSNVKFVNISDEFNPNDPSQSKDGLHLAGRALAIARAKMRAEISSVDKP